MKRICIAISSEASLLRKSNQIVTRGRFIAYGTYTYQMSVSILPQKCETNKQQHTHILKKTQVISQTVVQIIMLLVMMIMMATMLPKVTSKKSNAKMHYAAPETTEQASKFLLFKCI